MHKEMNETLFLVFKCYRKLTFVCRDLGTVVFPKFEQCVLWAAIILLKLNIDFVKRNTSHTSCHSFFWQAWIYWTQKYQLPPVTSSCWLDLQMPILIPMHICFQFFKKKCFLQHQWNGHKCTFLFCKTEI